MARAESVDTRRPAGVRADVRETSRVRSKTARRRSARRAAAIAAALEQGSLNWSAARELTRVAVVESEREWLEAARGKTVHPMQSLVAGKISGDRPPRRSGACDGQNLGLLDASAAKESASAERAHTGGTVERPHGRPRCPRLP